MRTAVIYLELTYVIKCHIMIIDLGRLASALMINSVHFERKSPVLNQIGLLIIGSAQLFEIQAICKWITLRPIGNPIGITEMPFAMFHKYFRFPIIDLQLTLFIHELRPVSAGFGPIGILCPCPLSMSIWRLVVI